MSLESIAGNLIAAFLYAIICFALKAMRCNLPRSERPKPQKQNSKKVLKRQFFVALFLLVASIAVYCSIRFHPVKSWLSSIRMLFGLAGGIAFIATWGAFEEAFAFYPPDDLVPVPSDQSADHHTR